MSVTLFKTDLSFFLKQKFRKLIYRIELGLPYDLI